MPLFLFVNYYKVYADKQRPSGFTMLENARRNVELDAVLDANEGVRRWDKIFTALSNNARTKHCCERVVPLEYGPRRPTFRSWFQLGQELADLGNETIRVVLAHADIYLPPETVEELARDLDHNIAMPSVRVRNLVTLEPTGELPDANNYDVWAVTFRPFEPAWHAGVAAFDVQVAGGNAGTVVTQALPNRVPIDLHRFPAYHLHNECRTLTSLVPQGCFYDKQRYAVE